MTRAVPMKKILMLIVVLMLSCLAGHSQDLYYWGGQGLNATRYEELSYKSAGTQTQKSLCKLICVYEKMVSNPGGLRKMPPPGICAEYGYLLLKPETAEAFINTATPEQKRIFDRQDFPEFFKEYGEKLMTQEFIYYPESEKFLRPLLERFVKMGRGQL